MNRPAAAIPIHIKPSISRICRLGKAFRRRIRLTLKGMATPTVMGACAYSALTLGDTLSQISASAKPALGNRAMIPVDFGSGGITACRRLAGRTPSSGTAVPAVRNRQVHSPRRHRYRSQG